jgi:hypothetical protein
MTNIPTEQETPVTEMTRVQRRSFKLYTDGEHPPIDRLSIIMQLLGEATDMERRAAIAYAADYYGYQVYRK